MSTFSGRQLAMVINLDKCIGCQTCTTACKNLWTNQDGKDYMYWNNVETKPGPGYPKAWENMGGGFKDGANYELGTLPKQEDYGPVTEYDYQSGLFEGGGVVMAEEEPTDGPNWDEEQGAGEFPNSYFFYLPRLCNHCTNPVCLDACTRQAVYKREQDGIVLVDQDRCRGYRHCVQACPYKKIMFNALTNKSEKCVFCYPLVEEGKAGVCATQCPGRVRFVGFLDDTESAVYKLVHAYGVALPLHPEYGTEPNVYYVPPFSGPAAVDGLGRPNDDERIPFAYLRSLFGDNVDDVIRGLRTERELVRQGGDSGVLDLLNTNDRFNL